MKWENILPGVWIFRDSCNVYAVQGKGGVLIIDAGTGRWLEHLGALPAKSISLAITHYFRDHSAGAVLASRAGIPVHVPDGEREILADPAEHFRRRSTYIIYDNLWDLFAPIEGVPVTGVLRDYEKTTLAGLEVEVVPLPGATINQIGLAIDLPDAGKVIFCGEAIHSPGKVARVAPYQYDYNDFGGSVNAYYSAHLLRQHKPRALLPSLGEPMTRDTDQALSALQDSLKIIAKGRVGLVERMESVNSPALEKVTDHVWRATHSVSTNWFLINKAGTKALAMDYGYQWQHLQQQSYGTPLRRRALLHSLDGLKKQFGIDRIDVVLVSHFHDDHVCGIPTLQRLHGTQCWAAENFADLLEQPSAHIFPCDWPVPIKVNRRMKLDEPFTWEGYPFQGLHAMNGHTRFSTLIGFEADGKRFAHTGDQYFFLKGWGLPKMPPFAEQQVLQNHVYRNGALLDGFDESAKWMLKWRPEIVLNGHQPPFHTDEHFFRLIEEQGTEYRTTHERIMPLGESDAHFNVDSWGGWIWPYRTHLKSPGTPAKVKATVRNPLPRRAKLEVRLIGPQGWRGTSSMIDAPARAEVSVDLEITPSAACRRQPYAVELVADGRPFGQVAEAMITVGGAEF